MAKIVLGGNVIVEAARQGTFGSFDDIARGHASDPCPVTSGVFERLETEPTLGACIGPYRTTAALTSGGMGSLYVAVRPPDRTPVAIKLVRRALRDRDRMERMFRDESRSLARLHHPNTVRCLRFGESFFGPYLAMEYVHGCSLRELLKELQRTRRHLPVVLAVYIAERLLAALHSAHEATDASGRPLSLVHRDVSPDNAMIRTDGTVKLIDFGVACASGNREGANDKLINGKIRYMAPEQAVGSPVDRRTDVYSLGAVLFELLTSRPVIATSNYVSALAQLTAPAPAPSQLRPGLPSALDPITRIALACEPHQRFSSARAMQASLRRVYPTVAQHSEACRAALANLVSTLFADSLALRLAALEAAGARAATRNINSQRRAEQTASHVSGTFASAGAGRRLAPAHARPPTEGDTVTCPVSPSLVDGGSHQNTASSCHPSDAPLRPREASRSAELPALGKRPASTPYDRNRTVVVPHAESSAERVTLPRPGTYTVEPPLRRVWGRPSPSLRGVRPGAPTVPSSGD